MIFVDATGFFLTYGSAPTGIPRVEDFIVRAALADPDPTVKLVRLDRRHGAYRFLNAFERQQLAESSPTIELKSDGPSRLFLIRQVFAMIRKNPTIGREADRHLADLVAQSRRRGLLYGALKTLFRAYRTYRLGWTWIAQGSFLARSEAVDSDEGVVLMSNVVAFGSLFSIGFNATKHRAFLCHDIIPITHSEFAIDAKAAERFKANLDRLAAAKATAICPSAFSCAALAAYVGGSGAEAMPIHRFDMPSALFEQAQAPGSEPRASDDAPFVIYCATIEARKNHLMLARIWKRAKDEGVALPRLICIGKWGWGVEDLRAFLADNPALSSEVIFLGALSDGEVIERYRAALFGVMPSHVEGWGLCASECLDFGVPVVVSTAPTSLETTHGIMPTVHPNDEDGWYREIRRLAHDADWRAELKRRIDERHKPTSTTAGWASIKQALLKADKAATGAPPTG